MTNPVRRPLLRYHGGKWNLAPWIISHFPAHRVYVEPFGGAASVLLRKPRAYAEIWNDLDQEVVNLFRVLRDPLMAEQLRAHLELTPFAREEFEQSYERATDPVEQARRMIARSYQGFGSAAATRETTGFRAASRRSGTIPAHDWDNYPKQLGFAIRRLKSVVIENRPAVDLIQIHDGDDTLFYVDPPYVHTTRGRRRTSSDTHSARFAYNHEMTDEDHSALAEVLHQAAGAVVLSGYPSVLYEDLYGDWTKVERTALADGARKRTEALWLNQKASSGIQMDLLER